MRVRIYGKEFADPIRYSGVGNVTLGNDVAIIEFNTGYFKGESHTYKLNNVNKIENMVDGCWVTIYSNKYVIHKRELGNFKKFIIDNKVKYKNKSAIINETSIVASMCNLDFKYASEGSFKDAKEVCDIIAYILDINLILIKD